MTRIPREALPKNEGAQGEFVSAFQGVAIFAPPSEFRESCREPYSYKNQRKGGHHKLAQVSSEQMPVTSTTSQ